MRALRLWTAAAAGPAVAAGFYALAALRRRRSLHPRGIGYQGWLQVPNESPPRPGVPLFQTEALRFNPWTTGPGIHPSGWLNLLRDAAYQASQRGRVRNTRRPGTSVVQVRWRGGVENQVPSRGR
jgi:hypothetical protein